jgi:hypothetical protein
MKTFWNLGVCLLLLGIVAAGSARGQAADIQLAAFNKMATTSASASAGEASTGPFQEEVSVSKAPVSKGISSTLQMPEDTFASPCCTEATCDDQSFGFLQDPNRFWFQGEYMLWWTNGAHLPPMVSTQDAIGNLVTVFGDRTIRDGDHDGYRIGMGMWLDCCHCWGVEGEYFDFRGKPDNFDSGLSNGYDNGTYFPIVRALFDPNADPNVSPNPQVSGIGFPTRFVGRVTVDTSDYFQSAGLWLRRNLRAAEWEGKQGSSRSFRLDVVTGYRFTRLLDSVNARDDEMDVNPASANLWTEYTNAYDYKTTNNFNGWEIGLDTTMTRGPWSLDILAKAAIGVNNQDLQYFNLYRVDQSVAQLGINQQTAAQDISRNVFSWIPELTVTAGYQAMEHVKVTVAYDLIYWSAVVRAADQIAEPTTGYPYGSLTGATQLPNTLNQSYFWAQGFRLGGEIQF